MFLLDTNVVSEFVKPRPDERVVRWMNEIDEDQAFISVVSFAEIRRGIALLDEGKRKQSLDVWLREDLPFRFEGRIIDIDRAVAEDWGTVISWAKRNGIGLSALDAFIAASARVRELTIVTRNTKDFAALSIPLADPWLPVGTSS